MFTKFQNGAEVEVEEVYKYLNGAEQEAEAVYAYKSGAEERVWPMEVYLITDGYLADGYSAESATGQNSYAGNDDCKPTVTNGYAAGGYYSVNLGVYLQGDGTNAGYGKVVFSPSIDLSKHKTLWVEMAYMEMEPSSSSQDISSSQVLFLSDGSSTSSDGDILATAVYYGRTAAGHGLYKIDLSTLAGAGYLHFKITFDYGGGSYSSAKNHEAQIYNMWMD